MAGGEGEDQRDVWQRCNGRGVQTRRGYSSAAGSLCQLNEVTVPWKVVFLMQMVSRREGRERIEKQCQSATCWHLPESKDSPVLAKFLVGVSNMA